MSYYQQKQKFSLRQVVGEDRQNVSKNLIRISPLSYLAERHPKPLLKARFFLARCAMSRKGYPKVTQNSASRYTSSFPDVPPSDHCPH
jgi:hypothetical protein